MENIKPIEGFDGYYVSDLGNVYSELGRGNRHNGKVKELKDSDIFEVSNISPVSPFV